MNFCDFPLVGYTELFEAKVEDISEGLRNYWAASLRNQKGKPSIPGEVDFNFIKA